MSTMASQQISRARGRMPRLAEAAVARARLTVVPAREVQAPRAPFVTLVLLLLTGGVVGLLLLNTHMQQASFHATALQNQADQLKDRKQDLAMSLDQLNSPTSLAEEARGLGMVVPAQAGFVQLPGGKVLGQPATSAEKLRIAPWPATKPHDLNPAPIIVRVPAKPTPTPGTTPTSPTPTTTQKKPAGTGPASHRPARTAGKKKAAH